MTDPSLGDEEIAAKRKAIEAEIRTIGEQRVRVLEESETLRQNIETDPPHGSDLHLATWRLRTLIERDEMLLQRLAVLNGRLDEIRGDFPFRRRGHRIISCIIVIAKIAAAIYVIAFALKLLAWLAGWSNSPFLWVR